MGKYDVWFLVIIYQNGSLRAYIFFDFIHCRQKKIGKPEFPDSVNKNYNHF
jgi:hypothetical protein